MGARYAFREVVFSLDLYQYGFARQIAILQLRLPQTRSEGSMHTGWTPLIDRVQARKMKMSLRRWLAQSRPQSLLSIPFIYAMIIPLLLLDLSVTLYQAICFPLYGIAKARRRDYIAIDRHRLPYLNAIEKFHCLYCSYGSGLLAYAREITARTEQYWCPIKHARPLADAHARTARFLEYGDPTAFHARSEQLRRELAPGEAAEPTTPAVPSPRHP
jgi:hypothetical protein